MNIPDNDFIKKAKGKDPQKLLNTLSKEDREKVNKMLSDKEGLKNLLNSPEAKAIMKMLSSKGKNG